jgi:hypothetical protein
MRVDLRWFLVGCLDLGSLSLLVQSWFWLIGKNSNPGISPLWVE